MSGRGLLLCLSPSTAGDVGVSSGQGWFCWHNARAHRESHSQPVVRAVKGQLLVTQRSRGHSGKGQLDPTAVSPQLTESSAGAELGL